LHWWKGATGAVNRDPNRKIDRYLGKALAITFKPHLCKEFQLTLSIY